MSDQEKSLKKDLLIDPKDLGAEWLNQPSLFNEWGRLHSEAVFVKDQAKDRLALVEAELDGKIRKAPELFGLEKVTDKAINSAIIRDSDYQEALEELRETEKIASELSVAKYAMDQRKTALEMLSRLFINDLYADPNIVEEAREKLRDHASKEQTKALAKSKRLGNLKK